MEIGITFSHRNLKETGFDSEKCLLDAKKLGVKWLRLCSYWDEIEEKEGNFNFKEMDKLLDFCDMNNLKVVLTVGMKAPRYPEYYIPKWLSKRLNLRRLKTIDKKDKLLLIKTLKFIETAINHFKSRKSIKVWQIENEPMDNSGEKWMRISKDFLNEEVELVKKIDRSRKVLINLWANELGVRKVYKKAIELADMVGFDVYLRHPVPFFRIFHRYIGPLDSREKMKELAEEINYNGKDLFIAELQAEPWEPGEILTTKDEPPSFLPEHFEGNLEYVSYLNPKVVLLWGFEYWLLRKERGNYEYWNEAVRIINKFNK